jgi:dihydroorotate dehydrogenase (fumarate)
MLLDRLGRVVGHLHFSNPLVYGGGTLKTIEDVEKMCRSAAAGGEIGTITPHSKGGNSGNIFYAHFVKGVLIYTLNSLGLRNPGKEYWTTELAKRAIKMAHDTGKLIGINIAADTVHEVAEMYLWAVGLGFDWVTINAGCPNKWLEIGGKQVPQAILSCDTGDTEELMATLEKRAAGSDTPTWWKPSPDNDTLGTQVQHAEIVAKCSVITAWIANNTVPHCYALEDGKPAITPGGGLAGMAGPAVKPKALGDIRRLREKLPERIEMIGAGGATYGSDILDYLRGGARIVHFASAHWASDFDFNVSGNMLGELCGLPETEAFLEAA